MSIQSEITRLSGNVSDALDEIAAKGVTVPAGSNSDDLATLIRQIPAGSGSAVTVVDTPDSHGGTIREITAVSLAGDTTSAAVTLQGYTGHDALGNPFTGTYVPSGSANIQASKSYTVSSSGNQTIAPDTGYDAMGEVALTVPAAEAATPSLELYTTAGVSAIRATTNQQTGWVTGAQKSGSYTLTRIAGQTITPTTSEQTVIANGAVVHAYNGAVKVAGSSALTAGNIKSGTTIFGITGTYAGLDTSDATATAADIASGKTAYVNGSKIIGTASGGSSSWTLLASTTLTVQTTSTAPASAGTVNLGSGHFDKDKIIWVHIRDRSGKRDGYFYGSDTYFQNYQNASGVTSTLSVVAQMSYCYNNSAYAATSGPYGVYGYSLTNAGVLTIRRRYNSYYTLTINSTYDVEVYELTPPADITMFE